MYLKQFIRNAIAAFVFFFAFAGAHAVLGQSIGMQRDTHQLILKLLRSDIEKNYYDPNFHGVDLDARFASASEKLKTANSVSDMSAIVAQVLVDFNDSHLFYLPPGKASRTEYGFDMAMFGDKCFIIDVTPGSDAEKQGLKPGDELFALNGFGPTRDNLWKLKYLYWGVRPQVGLKLGIAKPDGTETELIVKSKIIELKRVIDNIYDMQEVWKEGEKNYDAARRQRYHENIDDLLIWKMPGFALEPSEINGILAKLNKRGALILDLRGNGGGRVDMLTKLLGSFFAEDVKIADVKERKKSKPLVAKSSGSDHYKGKVVVLIDNRSGSASEMFARVMQIESRATIIGDRSAGAVMESIRIGHTVGVGTGFSFGASMTIADVIMTDGKSLERVGVTPDVTVIPTGLDLANGRDPVLARAAEFLGFKLSPEEAGKIFPIEEDQR